MLKAMPFKIVEYNHDGTPRLFELQPPGEGFDIQQASTGDGTCILFASEKLIRSPWPSAASGGT